MAKFKDPKVQKRYEYGMNNHTEMVKGMNGMANAYRRAYLNEKARWLRSWSSYPLFAAGRDTRRKHQKQGIYPVK